MRYTVRQAADILGISESAVRNRLSRGTLASERADGVTYVVLDDISSDTPPTDAATDYRDELIQVLREQLDAEREANRENRRLLAAALGERQRELEGSTTSRSPEEEPPENTEGSERRPWWRRIFGG